MKNIGVKFVVLILFFTAFNAVSGISKERNNEKLKFVEVKNTYRVIPLQNFQQTKTNKFLKVQHIYRVIYKSPCTEEQRDKNIASLSSLSVYPVPASDYARLNIPVAGECHASIELFSINGNRVLSKSVILNSNLQYVDFDLSNYESGVYYFIVNCGNSISSTKLTIIR